MSARLNTPGSVTALTSYAGCLDHHGWAYATQYLQPTALRQVNKWLIAEQVVMRWLGHPAAGC
jgi:membrane-bound lytic murein transglycosylase B